MNPKEWNFTAENVDELLNEMRANSNRSTFTENDQSKAALKRMKVKVSDPLDNEEVVAGVIVESGEIASEAQELIKKYQIFKNV